MTFCSDTEVQLRQRKPGDSRDNLDIYRGSVSSSRDHLEVRDKERGRRQRSKERERRGTVSGPQHRVITCLCLTNTVPTYHLTLSLGPLCKRGDNANEGNTQQYIQSGGDRLLIFYNSNSSLVYTLHFNANISTRLTSHLFSLWRKKEKTPRESPKSFILSNHHHHQHQDHLLRRSRIFPKAEPSST